MKYLLFLGITTLLFTSCAQVDVMMNKGKHTNELPYKVGEILIIKSPLKIEDYREKNSVRYSGREFSFISRLIKENPTLFSLQTERNGKKGKWSFVLINDIKIPKTFNMQVKPLQEQMSFKKEAKFLKKYYLSKKENNKISMKIRVVSVGNECGAEFLSSTCKNSFNDKFEFVGWTKESINIFSKYYIKQKAYLARKHKNKEDYNRRERAKEKAQIAYRNSAKFNSDWICVEQENVRIYSKSIKRYKQAGIATLKLGMLVNKKIKSQEHIDYHKSIYKKKAKRNWKRKCSNVEKLALKVSGLDGIY